MDDAIKQKVNQSTGEYLLFTLYWLAFFFTGAPNGLILDYFFIGWWGIIFK
tara:strand:+ start:542 stop:694 length:153 start_codon:yes stop_codon:yes gene_type:complete